MSFGKRLVVFTFFLFFIILVLGLVKKSINKKKGLKESQLVEAKIIDSDNENLYDDMISVDRVNEFFNKGLPKFPIVKTITYTSRVPWKEGGPAWIADYAAYYKTSRHFIARSLNGCANYDSQNVNNGDLFNVFDPDKNFEFYLVVDLEKAKMFFYYCDLDNDTRELIKSYDVGLGRENSNKVSGYLTPIGKYSLGNNVAVYRPYSKGIYNGSRIDMMTVFGSRWIPFESAIEGNSEPAKGFGIHGAPWTFDKQKEEKIEKRDTIGKYESDGCIRMLSEDIEELFSIIITKPSYVYIVPKFQDAKLPGDDLEK